MRVGLHEVMGSPLKMAFVRFAKTAPDVLLYENK